MALGLKIRKIRVKSVLNDPSVPGFDKLPPTLQRFFAKFPPTTIKKYSATPTSTRAEDANPFMPNKHPVTLRYHAPRYSLRQQSMIYKAAYRFGIQDLLPPMKKKFYEEKYNNKKLMRGVLAPKGHKYDLAKPQKLAKIEESLAKMDEKIIEVKGNKYKRILKKKQSKVSTWY
ncbi:mitochondrial 54S ribosomal protein mL59 ASCRUDRAFT_82470 [Ascoidea rubescens DSM 1968]|uniref:Large ribosomal subunit protein mL59 domain-containing protein n=1 Tax=Ascoidea rubescens DSM 1968 TaxID=1344418 RepID=A0A1D2VAX6_9ASCO|nr:hypothetical protein ASCRUDRAFT_82470 [Ascoidea rubescens DSM 1968]ODV58812.1 hypothetical protein ASCRUDRAFT_82470 [Ascoidea rubescens DSM 1968]